MGRGCCNNIYLSECGSSRYSPPSMRKGDIALGEKKPEQPTAFPGCHRERFRTRRQPKTFYFFKFRDVNFQTKRIYITCNVYIQMTCDQDDIGCAGGCWLDGGERAIRTGKGVVCAHPLFFFLAGGSSTNLGEHAASNHSPSYCVNLMHEIPLAQSSAHAPYVIT